MIVTVLSGVETAAAASVKSGVRADPNRSAAAVCLACAVKALNAAIAFRVPIDSEVGIPLTAEADTVLVNSAAIDGEGGIKGRFPSSDGSVAVSSCCVSASGSSSATSLRAAASSVSTSPAAGSPESSGSLSVSAAAVSSATGSPEASRTF